MGVQVALFGSGIILARSLGPAGRGDLAVALILPSVALQLACFGLPSAATYYVARNKGAARAIARQLAPVAALQALLALGLLVGLTEVFLGGKAESTQTIGMLTLAGVPPLAVHLYGLHLLQGLGDLRWFNAFRITIPATFVIGLAIGLLSGLTVVSCTLIWLASVVTVSGALVVSLVFRVRVAERRAHANLEGRVPTRRQMVRFGATGFLAQVSPVETFRIDTLVVAGLFSSEVVGYYAVALSISNVPRFLADGIVAVAYPQISAQDANAARASTRRYMLAAIVACGGATAALALAAPYIIPLLFGRAFSPAVALGVALVIGAGLISIRRTGSDCLRAQGRAGLATRIEVVALVVLAAGFLVFAPSGQGLGVAYALIASAAVGLSLTLLALRTTTRDDSAADT
ncbi:MAG: oligosaccharide flippase family protein [Actinobacteria bacterium]|nr:oligosaccharide flippase family protein [Actinomycetota bacterium]